MSGAHNWELFRDLYLARYAGDTQAAAGIEHAIAETQASCVHVPNPEHPSKCYKCGRVRESVPAKCGVVYVKDRKVG